MARPREFDRDAVLRAAVGVFWRNGYARTSVQDLVEVLGIHRASLYESFGSKERLFREVVQRYSDMLFGGVFAALGGAGPFPEEASPLECLDRFLGAIGEMVCSSDHPGCLVEGTLLAEAEGLTGAREACLEHVTKVDRKLHEVVCAGQVRGELREDKDPSWLVRVVRGGMAGMSFAARVERDPAALTPIREGVLRAIA